MAGWLVFLGLLTALAAIIFWRLVVGNRTTGYLAIHEIWVYTTETRLPPQERIMDRVLKGNPHNRPGVPCIGVQEGLLFSDVRTHLAVALRSKNTTAFRPDLFHDSVVPTKEVLDNLADCPALVKVRFASEVVLKDSRHVQFVAHLAGAISDLMGGMAVFDSPMETITTADEYRASLAANPNANRPEAQVRVSWHAEAEGCYARTHGLQKVGWNDLYSDLQEADHEVLVTGIMLRLAYDIYRRPDQSGPWEFDEFGDLFLVEDAGTKEGKRTVSIKRRLVVTPTSGD